MTTVIGQHKRGRRVLKLVLLIFMCLIILTVGAFVWFVTRSSSAAALYTPGPTGRRIVAGDVTGNYFPVNEAGRRPAILLLGGAEGGLGRDPMRQALLLQKAGYNVLHLAYFNAPGKPTDLSRVPLEEFFHALDWLKNQPEVDPGQLAIVGYSKGAEAALLTATRYPGIKAVVAGMPSSVVWDALDRIDTMVYSVNSSWTLGGKQLPRLRYGRYDGAKGVLSVFVNGLKEREANPDAIIPVERFTGQLLLVCGERDTLWPSCLMAEQVVARVTNSHKPPPVLLRYAKAGHGVMGAPVPATDRDMTGFAKLGGTAEDNAAARRDSWPKIITFLNAALASASPMTRSPK